MFEPSLIKPDTSTHRTCGTCEESKPVVEFYRDGSDAEGNPKYRRDCKDCYRKSRLLSRRAKRAPVTPPKRRKK